MENLIVIGAGPAGMTAALYAARKGLKPLVLSKDLGGQANWSSSVENYMGFKNIRGSELMQRFEDHMKSQELRYEECTVENMQRIEGGFEITCAGGNKHQSRSVIAATGKRPKTLDVPGETDFRGKGVSYCATCDGPLFRGVPVAVAGGGNAGLQACRDLMEFASEVHLIDPDGINADQAVRERVIGSDKLHLHEHYRVSSIGGEKTVTHIKISGPDNAETDLAVQGLFVEIGLLPNSDPVGLAARNGNGEVIVDCYCRTDVPGLFAAGDVTTACGKQIIIAAGEGAKAAIAVGQFLDYG